MMVISFYVLELNGGKYYVGQASDANLRLGQHSQGLGAKWTQFYKPVRQIDVQKIEVLDSREAMMHENRLTIEYMEKFGWENVRGGDYNAISTDRIRELIEDIYDTRNNVRKNFTNCINKSEYFFGPTSHWLVYVLSLENGKFYIGSTKRLGKSVGDHFSGNSSNCTKINKPISVIELIIVKKDSGQNYREIKAQKYNEYAGKFGKDNIVSGLNTDGMNNFL